MLSVYIPGDSWHRLGERRRIVAILKFLVLGRRGPEPEFHIAYFEWEGEAGREVTVPAMLVPRIKGRRPR